MKIILYIIPALFLVLTRSACHHSAQLPVLEGRLEIKGPCANYTVKLLKGKLSEGQLEQNWTDSETGKTYQQVFSIGNRCSFPDSIQQGDTFNFVIDSVQPQRCMVCMTAYPRPDKSLFIKVISVRHQP